VKTRIERRFAGSEIFRFGSFRERVIVTIDDFHGAPLSLV
jgi:hypothetical protein